MVSQPGEAAATSRGHFYPQTKAYLLVLFSNARQPSAQPALRRRHVVCAAVPRTVRGEKSGRAALRQAPRNRAELPAQLALPARRAGNRVRLTMLFSAPLLFKAFEVHPLLLLKRQVFL